MTTGAWKRRGKSKYIGGTVRKMKREQEVERKLSMIPALSTGDEESQTPYVISLYLNGRVRNCLIDTGAAVSLIQKKVVLEEELPMEDYDELSLTGITGHSLHIFGIVQVTFVTLARRARVGGVFIVCEDNILGERGEIEVLLGRDFLAAHKARIMCGVKPIIELEGEVMESQPERQEIQEEKETMGIVSRDRQNTLKEEVCTGIEEDTPGEQRLWEMWLQKVKRFYGEPRNHGNRFVVTAQVHRSGNEEGEIVREIVDMVPRKVEKRVEDSIVLVDPRSNNGKKRMDDPILEVEEKINKEREICYLQERLARAENAIVELETKWRESAKGKSAQGHKGEIYKGEISHMNDKNVNKVIMSNTETTVVNEEVKGNPERSEVSYRCNKNDNVKSGNTNTIVQGENAGKTDKYEAKYVSENKDKKQMEIKKVIGPENNIMYGVIKGDMGENESNRKGKEIFNCGVNRREIDKGENTERVKSTRITSFNRKMEPTTFEVADLVYLKDMGTKMGVPMKLIWLWKGPYRVIDTVRPLTYRIRKVGSREEQIVHVNRLKKYYHKEGTSSSDEDPEDSCEEEKEADSNNEDEDQIPRKFVFPQWMGLPREDREDMDEDQMGTNDEIRPQESVPLRRSTRIRRPPERLNL